jgi:hypothetical protein
MAGAGRGAGGGGNKPLPPRIMPWVAARHGPLALPGIIKYMPDNYLKLMPKYNAEKKGTAEEHLDAFQNFTDNLNVEHEDVYMRIFVQTLDGDVRKWFINLGNATLDSWEALEASFLEQWGDKNDYQYYLTEFASLKKKEN